MRKTLLMTPGPVEIPDEILKELSQPMIHHRTPEFEKVLQQTLQKLKSIFQTEEHVFIHAATGSGGMESSIANTLNPGDKAIVINSGKFGERWLEICKAYQIQTIPCPVQWGEAVDPNVVQNLLKQHGDVKALLCQACESSTAVLHPIKELASLVRPLQKTIFIVDSISALATTPMPMDEWGIDINIGASQKAFMLPAGLAFLGVSKKAWSFVEKSTSPRCYWDLRMEFKANQKNQTYFSSAVSHIRALNKVLDILLDEGLEKIVSRYEKRALAIRTAGELLNYEVFAKRPSPSVTAFIVPKGLDGEKIKAVMEDQHGISIAGGQDHLKGKIIRIGHMGSITNQQILLTIEKLADTTKSLGFSVNAEQAISRARRILES